MQFPKAVIASIEEKVQCANRNLENYLYKVISYSNSSKVPLYNSAPMNAEPLGQNTEYLDAIDLLC